MATEMTIEELKEMAKAEGLKVVCKKNMTAEAFLAVIEKKREELASTAKPTKKGFESPENAPECFGEFVVEGAKKCRACQFAQECKVV